MTTQKTVNLSQYYVKKTDLATPGTDGTSANGATDGLMSGADKYKLNGISPSSTTPSADTTNGSYGGGTDYARANHTHPKSNLYAEASHTHTKSQITDFPSIPTNLEDLTLSTGAVQTDTGLDVISYDNTIDVLYLGLGALSLDLSDDEVYYNNSEIATKGDIPVITGKEDSANKVSSWSATTNNTRYPSEKLVKDSLDTKLESSDLVDELNDIILDLITEGQS